MTDNPFEPPAAPTTPGWSGSVGFGIATLLYAAATTCCGVPGLLFELSGANPRSTVPDTVLLAVCTATYCFAFVPALAGLLRSRWMRPLHLGWAGATLVAELLATASYLVSRGDWDLDWLTAGVSLVLFCTWPLICILVLFRVDPDRPAHSPQ